MEMSKLWLFLNGTPANKLKPDLNKAAFQPPGDFAREQFRGGKNQNKKPTQTSGNWNETEVSWRQQE